MLLVVHHNHIDTFCQQGYTNVRASRKERIKMKRTISRLISLLFCFGAYALAEETEEKRTDSTGDYEYVLLEDDSTEIIRYTGTVEHLKIPAELDGYPVTSIGNDAFSNYSFLDDEFSNCDNLTSVNLPNSVTSIGDHAFFGCDNLTSVNLPNSVTSIGDHAFSGCDSLTSINLPNSVTSIGAKPFNGCNHLRTIRVSPKHPSLATIDRVLFDKSTKTLLCYPGGLDNVTYTIPKGIASIGKWAFSCCENLTSINIPDSVTSISANPFARCNQLRTIRVSPKHPTLVIIDGVLFDKSTKTLLCYPRALDNESYIVPQGTVSIGDHAFYDCDSLTSINLPDSVTSIGDSAFSGCDSLTSINIPDSVISIGDHAFSACDSLTSINIPDGVISIGDSTFSGCDSLTSLNLPDSVTSIGVRAFSRCGSLTSINISNSVTFIGKYAFASCPKLVLTVGPDTCAEAYAEDNGIPYVYYESSDWLNS